MKLLEAIELMKQGKKVKSKSWDADPYMLINLDGDIIDDKGNPIGLCAYRNPQEYVEHNTDPQSYVIVPDNRSSWVKEFNYANGEITVFKKGQETECFKILDCEFKDYLGLLVDLNYEGRSIGVAINYLKQRKRR